MVQKFGQVSFADSMRIWMSQSSAMQTMLFVHFLKMQLLLSTKSMILKQTVKPERNRKG